MAAHRSPTFASVIRQAHWVRRRLRLPWISKHLLRQVCYRKGLTLLRWLEADSPEIPAHLWFLEMARCKRLLSLQEPSKVPQCLLLSPALYRQWLQEGLN